MKPTEYPEEDSRAVSVAPSAPPAEPRPAPAPERPRYVEVPATPEQIRAQRNVAWGVVCLALAAVGLWLGLKFDRMASGLSLASSLGTLGVFWLLYNAQILRQRHGFFLAFGLVTVLAAALPFAAIGLRALDRIADESISGKSPEYTNRTVPPPVPTAANVPPAPSAPELSPDDEAEPQPSVTRPSTATGANAARKASTTKTATVEKPTPVDDGVIRDFNAPPIDSKAGKIIRIKEDCIVQIEGRTWRLKKGQTYPFSKMEDGMVTFMAGDHEVKIDSESVTFTGRSLETPARINQMAVMEAASRYPQLADPDSKEYLLFVKRQAEMEADPAFDTFFKNPKWPLALADQLAAAQGWSAADEGSATPEDNKPAANAPAAPAGSESPAAPAAPAAPAKSAPAGNASLPAMLPEDKGGWKVVPKSPAPAATTPAPVPAPAAGSNDPQAAPPAIRPAVIPPTPGAAR